MIRALFNLGGGSTRPRVGRKPSLEPRQVSRRDFLTFGRALQRADGTWRVTIDAGRCTDCNACTRICDEDALHRSERNEHVVYSLAVATCTGCEDCKTVCAENAVTVIREADRSNDIAEIAVLVKKPCPRCGQLQCGVIDGVCPICQRTNLLTTLRS